MGYSAVILAGGLGTRLRVVVADVPKPMAPVQDRPFLERQMDYWIGQGVDHFILSVGHMRGIIMQHFGARYRHARVEYAVEEQPLGTGGGLLIAASMLPHDQPFIAMNGDSFFPVQLDELRATHAQHDSQWTLALFNADQPNRYGKVAMHENGRLDAFISGKAEVGEAANAGVYLIDPAALAGWNAGDAASIESDIIPAFLATGGRCFGRICAGKFIDIGVPDDYHRAQTLPELAS